MYKKKNNSNNLQLLYDMIISFCIRTIIRMNIVQYSKSSPNCGMNKSLYNVLFYTATKGISDKATTVKWQNIIDKIHR